MSKYEYMRFKPSGNVRNDAIDLIREYVWYHLHGNYKDNEDIVKDAITFLREIGENYWPPGN